jgi:branched-chain amino acid transport system permease protein
VSNETLPRSALLFAVLLLALFPLGATTFYLQLGAKILIMAIFALSLDLLVGHSGLVSLGHAAYFGVGAYTLALFSPQYTAARFWATFLAALLIGYLVVRTGGVYFIMATLAFAQMLYALFMTPISVVDRTAFIFTFAQS